MSNQSDRLRSFLRQYVNTQVFDTPENVYKAFVQVEKDGYQSKHNYNDKIKLMYECLYRYNRAYSLENFNLESNQLPFNIDPNLSFEEFSHKMEEYQQYHYENKFNPDLNFQQILLIRMKVALKLYTSPGWYYLDSERIENKSREGKGYSRKIYLSVDNKNLHKFSVELLEKCSKFDVNYHFKISEKDDDRRCDNVVIYCSDSEFIKYITAIKEIKNENPNIEFGEASLLAYHYNDYIGVAPMEEEGAFQSHSQKLSEKIWDLRNEAYTFDGFMEDVKDLLSESLESTKEFCENIELVEKSSLQEKDLNLDFDLERG